ncbi:NuoI/complex I 23 kDa subunit family protein [candidate division KSB1 bacterium]
MKAYFRNIYIAFSTIFAGMTVTMRRMLNPSVTVQYPHQRLDIPDRARNQLVNIIDECNGCNQCVRACPVNCITLETIKAFDGEDLGTTSDGSTRRLHVTVYDIDMSKCCYCGLCTIPCPTEAVVMTDKYEYAAYNRDDLIFHFAKYTPEQVAEMKRRDDIRTKEKEAKKLAAEKAKAAAAAKKEAADAAGGMKKPGDSAAGNNKSADTSS